MRYIGRALQLIALLVMPSSMLVAHFERNEAKSIGLFVGSIALFFIGWLLARK